MNFVPLSMVAELAGVSRQALAKVCALTSHDSSFTWRGARLSLRQISGRGGRSGLRYEIDSETLPIDLQQRLKDHFAIVDHPVSRIEGSKKHNWFLLILSPALAHLPRSAERRAAIEAIASRPHVDWTGNLRKLSIRTIERWIAAADQRGAQAFVRQSRVDKNVSRVALSQAWDMAVTIDPVAKSQIAEQIRGYVRGLIVKDTQRTVIKTLAAAKLRELTIAAGMPAAAALPADVFELPRRIIDVESQYRKVAIFDKNRKAHEDAKPRIFRSRDGLQPQEIVVGDVHHLDIVMNRPDGSEAWPKAIAWLDLATNRIWMDLVLLEKGEGIRNADVIASFVRMVTAWGMPQSLYLDNGSEYRWPEFVDDALKLVARVDYSFENRASQVIRAKPYNAPAKAIEGIFGVLEQRYFRTLPGWAGGDRTNKRTHQVGKSTEPFPGTLQDLGGAIGSHLRLYEMTPQLGTLKGRSPRQTLEAAINAGWERVAIDARELHTVFATDEIRILRQGHISYGGDKWTCRELQRFQGDRVIVRAPKFDRPDMLALLDPQGRKVIGYALPAKRFGILDPAGAREAAEMDKVRRSGVRELRASAPHVDPNREIVRLVASIPAALPAPIGATIGVSDEAAEIARGLAETPKQRRDRAQDEADREHFARLAIFENALKKGKT